MISMQRTWAIVLRHLLSYRGATHVIWLFYWPLIDIFLFGFSGIWAQSHSCTNNFVGISMITGIIFLQILHRSNVEGSINLLEELWSHNMLNLFASPLRFAEWICATFILAIITSVTVFLYSALAAWLLYAANIFNIHPAIFLFYIPIFFSGLWLGFISAAIVICYGARAQSIAFMLSFFAGAFCGAIYPVDVLPSWAQQISLFLPMTPAFEGIRLLVTTDTFSWYHWGISCLLSCIYCGAALALFAYAFDRSKQKGFARLTVD